MSAPIPPSALLAEGQQVFYVDAEGVEGIGVVITEQELSDSIRDRVADILTDEEGRQELEELLGPLADTDFALEGLDRVLTTVREMPAWRVGEAIAEAYLCDHRCCLFPWPGGRDLKNGSASPAGTDLVGLIGEQADVRFAFGEVKTSTQEKCPPDVVTGRHGLVRQLEALCDCGSVTIDLVRYLAYHAKGRPWLDQYRVAAKRWLADRTEVSLFGVLIRDVDSDERDISGRVAGLAERRGAATTVELIAIYLPIGSIDGLPAAVSTELEARR